MAQATAFRRAFVDHGMVCMETGKGEVWYLPNGQGTAPVYHTQQMFERVKAAGSVNLEHWRRMS